MVFVMLVLGLVVLTAGAELLVRHASRLAIVMGVSPLVVGLTVVAFGTSAPELVVSVRSTWMGQPDVALGNVVGSNIFNVLFILGASALIVPLRVSQQLVRFEVPLMVILSLAVWVLARDGSIGRLDGALLVSSLALYTFWAIRKSRREGAVIQAEYATGLDASSRVPGIGGMLITVLLILVGLALLVLGARWFIDAANVIALQLGVSELVIGLTIVAAGTSLPEAATSILAAIRGERDIAVGNVVGSNLFNLMGVLGMSSLLSADGVAVTETAQWLDLPVMIAVSVACLPIFFTGHLIARWKGALLLFYYVAYTAWIVITVTEPKFERTFVMALFGVAIPLTLITLITGVVRQLRASVGRGVAGNGP